jgi:hypothetical protein
MSAWWDKINIWDVYELNSRGQAIVAMYLQRLNLLTSKLHTSIQKWNFWWIWVSEGEESMLLTEEDARRKLLCGWLQTRRGDTTWMQRPPACKTPLTMSPLPLTTTPPPTRLAVHDQAEDTVGAELTSCSYGRSPLTRSPTADGRRPRPRLVPNR